MVGWFVGCCLKMCWSVVCLFVCLFACLLACLLVCLFVCLAFFVAVVSVFGLLFLLVCCLVWFSWLGLACFAFVCFVRALANSTRNGRLATTCAKYANYHYMCSRAVESKLPVVCASLGRDTKLTKFPHQKAGDSLFFPCPLGEQVIVAAHIPFGFK